MAIPVWGLLEKGQADPEKIEEAIVRLIAEHNANEEAHLGAGQSLQSHKASVIIDHVVDSVIADKIKDREVPNEKLLDFGRQRYSLAMESLDCWVQSGGVDLSIGRFKLFCTVPGSSALLFADLGVGPSWAKKAVTQFVFKTSTNVAQTVYVVCGSRAKNTYTGQGIGFKIVNGQLYAVHAYWNGDGITDVLTAINGVTITNFHLYRVEFVLGDKIDFFVDDVLVATHTENLPSTDYPDDCMFSMYILDQDGGNKDLKIDQLYFTEDL